LTISRHRTGFLSRQGHPESGDCCGVAGLIHLKVSRDCVLGKLPWRFRRLDAGELPCRCHGRFEIGAPPRFMLALSGYAE